MRSDGNLPEMGHQTANVICEGDGGNCKFLGVGGKCSISSLGFSVGNHKTPPMVATSNSETQHRTCAWWTASIHNPTWHYSWIRLAYLEALQRLA